MSNFLAIAAITNRLVSLLDNGLQADDPVAGVTVTARPPDRARNGINGNQVNIYLHHSMPNPAWRNTDLPQRNRSGETVQPPLALVLHYLVTAYFGENEDSVDSTTDADHLLGTHRLLGRAMNILHDHPLLDATAINDSLPPGDRLALPYQQVERVRITPQNLSLDELSKLWSGFQTELRLSAAYEVSVVLIESTRPAVTPLPVLTIGPNDVGVVAQPNLLPPYPTLEQVNIPNSQPSARLGDILTLTGHHLDGDSLSLQFSNRHLEEPIEVDAIAGATDKQVQAQLPNEPENWPAGVYTVTAVISRAGEPDRVTNDLAFTLAPRLLSIAPNPAARDGGGNVTLTATTSPEILPAQRASLLLGSREVAAEPHPAQSGSLTFDVVEAPAGDHFLRLRVDGVNSLLINYTVTPPAFDNTQMVTIT